jgi:hypothetical protein
MILLTPKEIKAAAAWVESHNRDVHEGSIDVAEFAIRSLGGSGIGSRTVVTCEACERVKVRNENHHDVTDYASW